MLVQPRHELQRPELHILIVGEEEEDVGPGVFQVDFTGANVVETKHQQTEKMMEHHPCENIKRLEWILDDKISG